jgi:hypothetical protein
MTENNTASARFPSDGQAVRQPTARRSNKALGTITPTVMPFATTTIPTAFVPEAAALGALRCDTPYSFANANCRRYHPDSQRRQNPTQLSFMARPYHRRAVSSVGRAYSRDPLERIEFIGGTNSDHTRWKLTQAAAIAVIEAGTDEFFVKASDQLVKLVVVSRDGEKYLQSEREKTHPDELLHLTFG